MAPPSDFPIQPVARKRKIWQPYHKKVEKTLCVSPRVLSLPMCDTPRVRHTSLMPHPETLHVFGPYFIMK